MHRVDSEHGEQVHDWVCAPADNSHKLFCLDLALHNCISCSVGCGRETDEEFVDKVQEEDHREEPARPARCEHEVIMRAEPNPRDQALLLYSALGRFITKSNGTVNSQSMNR